MLFFKNAQQLYQVAPLEELGWLEHAFGTRHAGPEAAGLVTVQQIHSARVAVADGRQGKIGEADALIARLPGARVGVRTADCLPILLADERLRAVAAVHAGWRGTIGGIAQRAVAALAEAFGSRPEDLHAAIGPGIGSCCFEVGPEVAGQFTTLFPERRDLNRRTRLDLAEANRRQLVAAGVLPARIYCGAPCTVCMAEDFHSWRRDRDKAGRMLSVAGIRAQS